ncbi:adenylate/guanylate cyclase domain-containing protein [Roseofilum casamattae]|uniref:Adenylate/guanylate cyclase domain-containing protein n=1 Tax=Roseofilum casamattae BLCC-M143 TaxID=3022442 RepID=A0ABT7BUZ9_9CYAN|nr:adenylate/guanylate cyclase domain-containing protein [Roseofilum casamattae]MDJ1183012.1 adenylate/guanylate cyclase domain-containing protein [Roseofilum casamattae BLCC-M143]
MEIKLQRLIDKPRIKRLVREWLNLFSGKVGVFSAQGDLLMGDFLEASDRDSPVRAEESVIGWVRGDEGSQSLASLLNYIINNTISQKYLVNETLERYKEINLLYRISEEMSACLDINVIAELILEEARKILPAARGQVLFVEEKSQQFRVLASFGDLVDRSPRLALADGIMGHVLATGVAEVVNQAKHDPRLAASEQLNSSLICAPLKSRYQAFGVIWIGNDETLDYPAADLKLLTALASQAANAMENARLHEYQVQEERIKSNLERYMSPQLVKAIINNNESNLLDTGKKNLVMLFSDIRNFTTYCEILDPETIVEYLNIYFTYMVDVIFNYGGTVNKFVGDMIVCMFGAPAPLAESETKAIQAAIAMQKCLQTLPVPWIRDNFKTGIGISSGEVVVGNIGSRQHVDYTAIGDKVNTASRLQGMAKGGQILVDRTIYERTHNQFQFQEIGMAAVKGKSQTVEIFEVIY